MCLVKTRSLVQPCKLYVKIVGYSSDSRDKDEVNLYLILKRELFLPKNWSVVTS
jgi:hypothetical protein